MNEDTGKDERVSSYLAGAGWGGVKDARLHLAGQCAVDGKDDEFGDLRSEGLHAFVEDLTGAVNLLLTRQEQQDVS